MYNMKNGVVTLFTTLFTANIFFSPIHSSSQGVAEANSKPNANVAIEYLGKVIDKEFYVVSDQLTLSAARDACTNAGLSLAAIESKSEDDFLGYALVGGEAHWTDGVGVSNFGSYTWESIGKIVDESIQSSHENRTTEGITFRSDDWSPERLYFELTDESILPTHPALCQYRIPLGQLPIPLTRVGQVGRKTFFVELNNTLSWYEGLDSCSRLGLKLAAIETKEEQEFLMTSDFLTAQTNYWTSGRDHLEMPQFQWQRTGKPVTNFREEVQVYGIAFVGKSTSWNRYPLHLQLNVLCQYIPDEI